MKIGDRLAALLLLAAGVTAAAPPSIEAQERTSPMVALTGVVEDRSRGSGINSASVRFEQVLEEDGNVRSLFAAETTAGGGGRFSVPAIQPGTYRLRVQALGYELFEEEMELTGQAHIRVALVPEAIELEPLLVVSRRSRYLQDVGFYQRRETGRSGSTFTREEIESRPGAMISDLLRGVAGVTVRHAGLASPVVVFRSGCRPDLVIDGINLGTNARVDDLVRPSDVEGLEVHRGGTTLLPFSNSICGSLVVWTIDPSTREGGKPWTWGRLLTAAGLTALTLFIMR